MKDCLPFLSRKEVDVVALPSFQPQIWDHGHIIEAKRRSKAAVVVPRG